ncbi:response regulator transcription factor [Aquibium oceanicum]|uniref:DNA-binding response regulator n=1 Tax=Aquibium oceanicum TaxID=1670800 RepID=A0A1L3SNM7_9HYPH|nr:response regulator transcription factor [Aquibium oceanicum]APH71027.1 DNA-binding response regulator [Aquibium oceanicum]
MANVLLVDDDVDLGKLISEYLTEEGFNVFHQVNGRDVLAFVAEHRIDVIILDIMLPGMNGIEILRRIRRVDNIPVLMMTARGDEVDRIAGLDLGADDYLAKPCSPGELAARLRAILRRAASSRAGSADTIEVGDLSIDPRGRKALWKGTMLALTGAEFNLMEALASRPGQIVSRGELCELGLGRPLTRFERTIDVHMSSIRQKMGLLADGRSPIVNVRGQGYQLVTG